LLLSLGLLNSVQCIPAVSAVPEVKVVKVAKSHSFEKLGNTEFLWLVRNVEEVTIYSDGKRIPEKKQELLLCQSSDGKMGRCSPVHITCGDPGVQCHGYAPSASGRGTTGVGELGNTGKTPSPDKEDPVYWQTKCNNLAVSIKAVKGYAEKKRLMKACQEKCKAGASAKLRSCLRGADNEEDYQKCAKHL